MSNPFEQPGAFSWCELMTTDVEAAKTFYREIFDWEMKVGPVDGIDYTVLSAGDREIGGMMAKPADATEMPTAWGVYITVPDVAATVQKATALGGRVLMPPMDVPTVGKMAMLQDPQGANFYVITYNAPPA